jgi:hypothetical protein
MGSQIQIEIPKKDDMNAKELSAWFDARRTDLAHEHGHGGYTGTFAECPGISVVSQNGAVRTFLSKNDAETWLSENAIKWESALAVKFVDDETAWMEHPKRAEAERAERNRQAGALLAMLDAVEKISGTDDATKRFRKTIDAQTNEGRQYFPVDQTQMRFACVAAILAAELAKEKTSGRKTVSCSHCGSSLSLAHLKTLERCPVCSENGILKKTAAKKIEAAKAAEETAKRKLDEAKTATAEIRAKLAKGKTRWMVGALCSC